MKHKEMEKIKGKEITDKSTEGFWMDLSKNSSFIWDCLGMLKGALTAFVVLEVCSIRFANTTAVESLP